MKSGRATLRQGAAVIATVFVAAFVAPAAAFATPTDLNCPGGPLPGGTYGNVTISGACAAMAGDIHVLGNLTVTGDGGLVAAFAASNITIDGNLVVAPGGALILGCEPFAFKCFDDPAASDDNAPGTLMTNDLIRGSLIADGAIASVVHHTRINAGARQNSGGGGADKFNAIPVFLPVFGFIPAYSDYEDNIISGGLRVTNLATGWFGVFRNHVNGTVVLNNNVLFDTDANEVADNVVNGSLKCSGNVPAIQIGDSGGGPNLVQGMVTGQCVHPVVS